MMDEISIFEHFKYFTTIVPYATSLLQFLSECVNHLNTFLECSHAGSIIINSLISNILHWDSAPIGFSIVIYSL